MKKRDLGLLALGIVAAGCDSSVTTGGSGGAGTTSAVVSGSNGVSTASGSTVTGAGGALTSDVVTIKMDSFDVPSGQEVYKCQNFANPFGGAGEVTAFESHMTQGSHHLLLFYKNGATDGPLQDCSGLEFAATPYSTQLPDDALTFPSGVSALVPATMGLRLQSHYLNTSPNTITAHVEVTFHLAKPGEAPQHAGVLFVVEPNFSIAPHSTQTVTHDCKIPFGMNLLKATSHMHQHGTNFLATIAGQTVFQTTQWSDPVPRLFDPALPVSGGDALHFECTFQNDSSSALTFGESALTNEMCIFGASFYPVPSDQIVTVDCN